VTRLPLGSEVVEARLYILIVVVDLLLVERTFHRESLQRPLQSRHVLLATVTIQSLIPDVLHACTATVTMCQFRTAPSLMSDNDDDQLSSCALCCTHRAPVRCALCTVRRAPVHRAQVPNAHVHRAQVHCAP